MNGKKRLSITIIILVPVFILGALAIYSNIAAINNLKRVNSTAVTISDEHMVNISQLSNIEKEMQQMREILSEKKLDFVQFYVNFVNEILPDIRTGKKPLILKGKVA